MTLREWKPVLIEFKNSYLSGLQTQLQLQCIHISDNFKRNFAVPTANITAVAVSTAVTTATASSILLYC